MKFSLGKPKLLIKLMTSTMITVAEGISFFVMVTRKRHALVPVCDMIGGKSMLTSLSFIFLVGLAMGAICRKLKLPRIIGMLITGIILGPYVLDLLDPSILSISAELRKMALIIILLKAGLSLDLQDLKKAGRASVLLSFVPASCEIIGYVIFAPMLLGITRIETAVMGSVLRDGLCAQKLCQKQYEGHHCARRFFPAHRDRRMAGGKSAGIRAVGRSEYGLRDQI